MKGKYIYGIVNNNGKPVWKKGFFRRQPYSVTYKNLSAIVKDALMKTYEADQKGLLAHNGILSEIMKTHTVLPMRYGTIANSEDEVRELMKGTYPVLLSKLSKIKNSVEFDIEITITDEQPLIKEILEKNKEIRELREKLIAKADTAQLQEKLLIGKMIADEISKYKITLINNISLALKPFFLTQKILAGKNVLAILAFLVKKDKMEEFESTIYKLGERYGDRLKFKYTGPLAPYSFVEMKFIIVNFNTVDSARRVLGLGEQVLLNDIKEEYRRLAQECHPDKNPGDAVKEEKFKKITDSYKLLCEYSRRYPKTSYIFKPDKINSFNILVEEEPRTF